jgi:hypothetical protein
MLRRMAVEDYAEPVHMDPLEGLIREKFFPGLLDARDRLAELANQE